MGGRIRLRFIWKIAPVTAGGNGLKYTGVDDGGNARPAILGRSL